MTVALLALASLAALALAALCAGAETGYLSVSRERVLHLAREGGRKAALVQKAIGDMARTTTMLLIGNNIASVTYSAATAAISATFFARSSAGRLATSLLAAFIVLYVSEFMPKLLFAARPLRRILRVARAVETMALVLEPLTSAAMWLTSLFISRREQKYALTVSDLIHILEDRKDGVCLSDFESALVSRILVLRAKGRPITPEAILSALRDAP